MLLSHQSYAEAQSECHLSPPKCRKGYGQGQDALLPAPRLIDSCGSLHPTHPGSLIPRPPPTLSSSLLCPSLYHFPSPTPFLSPTGTVSLSLPSWVTGALQLFGSLFGRTSQRCPGLSRGSQLPIGLHLSEQESGLDFLIRT